MAQMELTRPPVERLTERVRAEAGVVPRAAVSPRIRRRWYQQLRYILPLGVLVCALLGTVAGTIRDEVASQPGEAAPAAHVVLLSSAT